MDDITLGVDHADEGAEPQQKRWKFDVGQVKAACKEAGDTIIVQASDCFESLGHLDMLQLVDPKWKAPPCCVIFMAW